MILEVVPYFIFYLISIVSSDSGFEWDQHPDDLNLGLGDSIVLNCSARGNPEPTITWFRSYDSSEAGNKGDYYKAIGDGPTYTIESVKLNDAGQYECKATSKKQSISWMFSIKVYEGPRFTSKQIEVTATRGTASTLSCEASGTKPITNTWHRKFSSGKLEPIESSSSRYSFNEKELENDNNRSLFNLHMDKVQSTDSGSYVCNANNDFGDDSMTIVLIVQDVPSTPEGLKIESIWTRSATFSWLPVLSNGSPIKSYILEYWQGNVTSEGKSVQQSVNGSLLTYEISNKLEPGIVYSVRLIAENSIGRSSPSPIITFYTKEEAPDGAPIDIKIESKTTRSLEVSWKAPMTNHWRGKLLGYHLAYKESTDSIAPSTIVDLLSYNVRDIPFAGESSNKYQQKLTINDLKAATTYSILIRAYNAAGAGPLSSPAFSSTSVVDPPKAPIIRNAEKKDSGFIIKLDEPSSNLGVNYYKIYYKEENSSWLSKSFPVAKSNEYELDGLKSNTWYYIYMIIDSDHGLSEPSQTINVKTLADSYSSDAITDPHDYNYENDLRSAKYYGSFIVIPIAVTIIIVVVVCAVAYVFVYVEERKTDIIRSNYMTHTPATNFQYLGPPPPSTSTLHHPTIMSTDNSVLSLHRYANDTIDRGQPLIPRTLMSNKGFDTLKCYYVKRPIITENVNPEYSTPYEARISRERSSSLPPVPESLQGNRMAGTINTSRNMPSQHIYMNGSQSSLASLNDLVKTDDQDQKDSDQRYDYFNFL